jgi:hypothetical protein
VIDLRGGRGLKGSAYTPAGEKLQAEVFFIN